MSLFSALRMIAMELVTVLIVRGTFPFIKRRQSTRSLLCATDGTKSMLILLVNAEMSKLFLFLVFLTGMNQLTAI